MSTLVYLSRVMDDGRYLEAAERAAQYLIRQAWNERSATFPFEPVSNGDAAYAYFFDCGIIARGLLAIWRATGNHEYFDRARECGLSMAFDFMAEEAMHPILRLPEKQPVAYEAQWSKRPGCYQLKSGLAWRELALATGHRELASAFERLLAWSLATHDGFLPGDKDLLRVMDRLHAYLYFLEALLVVPDEPAPVAALRSGIDRVAALLRKIEPQFARCDVFAQLLRLRVFAGRLGIVTVDEDAAEWEADQIRTFQSDGRDPRTGGGFWFGRKNGQVMPFSNPVSTAFALQALVLWQEYRDHQPETPVLALI